MFKIGDVVVHPIHGVCSIENYEEKDLCNKKVSYYVLNIFLKKMKILVPVENSEEVGLRKITDSSQIDKVFDVLKGKPDELPSNWNKRFKIHLDKIKTGDIFEVAQVVRNLYQKEKNKKLSLGEKRIYENVKHILIGEIVYSKGIEIEKAKSIIEQHLK